MVWQGIEKYQHHDTKQEQRNHRESNVKAQKKSAENKQVKLTIPMEAKI
jgi:hypothetical protein